MTMEEPGGPVGNWGKGVYGGPEGTGEGEGLERANHKNKLEENLKNWE